MYEQYNTRTNLADRADKCIWQTDSTRLQPTHCHLKGVCNKRAWLGRGWGAHCVLVFAICLLRCNLICQSFSTLGETYFSDVPSFIFNCFNGRPAHSLSHTHTRRVKERERERERATNVSHLAYTPHAPHRTAATKRKQVKNWRDYEFIWHKPTGN